MKSFATRLFVFLAALAAASALRAAEALPLSYQGQLTDANGNPRNGSFLMVFGVYDGATGGSPSFSDTQSVAVTSGSFNVLIGTGTTTGSLSTALSGGTPRFLQITVDGNPLMPRQRLAASPYAVSGSVGTVGKRLNVNSTAANIVALDIQDATFVKIIPTPNAFAVSGVTGGVDGRVVTLFNATNDGGADATDSMTIVNMSTSGSVAAKDRIKTGTGANMGGSGVFSAESSVTLVYDGEQQVWLVVSAQP